PSPAAQDLGAPTKQTAPRGFRLRRSLRDRQPRDFKGPRGPGSGFSLSRPPFAKRMPAAESQTRRPHPFFSSLLGSGFFFWRRGIFGKRLAAEGGCDVDRACAATENEPRRIPPFLFRDQAVQSLAVFDGRSVHGVEHVANREPGLLGDGFFLDVNDGEPLSALPRAC